MTTPEERYEVIKSHVDSMADVAKSMHGLGILGSKEYEAANVLLHALNRAMVVLDPVKTEDYLKSLEGESPVHYDEIPSGQYL